MRYLNSYSYTSRITTCWRVCGVSKYASPTNSKCVWFPTSWCQSFLYPYRSFLSSNGGKTMSEYKSNCVLGYLLYNDCGRSFITFHSILYYLYNPLNTVSYSISPQLFVTLTLFGQITETLTRRHHGFLEKSINVLFSIDEGTHRRKLIVSI